MANNIIEIENILNELKKLSGDNQIDKLKEYKDNELLKEILLYGSDGDKQYKIKEDKYNKVLHSIDLKTLSNTKYDWNIFKQYLDKFSEKKGVKEEEIKSLITEVHMSELFKQVLFKDLRLNMGIKSFQKVWNDFCVKPSVMLAKEFDGNMPKNALISRKLDGRRGYYLNGKFYSRNNKEYKSINIQHILDDLKQIEDIDNYVLDGEFVYIDESEKEDFSKTGIVTRDKYTEESKNIKFAVFYALDKNNFLSKVESDINFKEIYKNTWHLLLNREKTDVSYNSLIKTNFNNIRFVAQFDRFYFNDLLKESKEKNWEGLMVLDADKTYQYKRTKYLQKVKEFKDAEFKVIGFTIGKNKYSNTLGYITIELPTGELVDVGSGFTDLERDIIWQKQDKILENNLYITVQYFEESVDKNGKKSLRFPVFKGFRDKQKNEVNLEDLK